jgi:hypothetical protein
MQKNWTFTSFISDNESIINTIYFIKEYPIYYLKETTNFGKLN